MKNIKNTKSVALKVILLFHLVSANQLFSQNVGIGIVNPLQRLHIGGSTGTIRIDGLATGGNFIAAPSAPTDNLLFSDASGDIYKMPNGAIGQIPSIGAGGSVVWVNAPVKYEVKGTTSATLTSTNLALMPQMTITFVPKSSTVWVFFYAMGSSNQPERPIQFQLRKVGTPNPIIQFRASSEASMGNDWVSSFSFPVSVTPGLSTTLEVLWATIPPGGYQIINSGAIPACRSLMVLDM